jgi:hypothetical protein
MKKIIYPTPRQKGLLNAAAVVPEGFSDDAFSNVRQQRL